MGTFRCSLISNGHCICTDSTQDARKLWNSKPAGTARIHTNTYIIYTIWQAAVVWIVYWQTIHIVLSVKFCPFSTSLIHCVIKEQHNCVLYPCYLNITPPVNCQTRPSLFPVGIVFYWNSLLYLLFTFT